MALPALVTPDSDFNLHRHIPHLGSNHAPTRFGETIYKKIRVSTNVSSVEHFLDMPSDSPGISAPAPILDNLFILSELDCPLDLVPEDIPVIRGRKSTKTLYTRVIPSNATPGVAIVRESNTLGRSVMLVHTPHLTPTLLAMSSSGEFSLVGSPEAYGGASTWGTGNASHAAELSNCAMLGDGSCDSQLISPSRQPAYHTPAVGMCSLSISKGAGTVGGRAALADRLHALIRTISYPSHVRHSPFPVSSSLDTFVVGEDSENEDEGCPSPTAPSKARKTRLSNVAIHPSSSLFYMPSSTNTLLGADTTSKTFEKSMISRFRTSDLSGFSRIIPRTRMPELKARLSWFSGTFMATLSRLSSGPSSEADPDELPNQQVYDTSTPWEDILDNLERDMNPYYKHA